MKKFFWLFAYPSLALAQPAPDVVKWVQDSLHPGISVVDGGTREDDCSPSIVKLSGADPVTNQPRQVQIAVYTPSESTNAQDVLVFPPTGGENFIDREYASALCGAGMRATILETWDHDVQRDMDLGTYDRAAIRTLAAAEHALEYLNPSKPVALLGASLGAIEASFVLGYEERIKTAVLIVGGDHLADIIAHSTEKGVAEVREKQMEAGGFHSIEEFQTALDKAIHVDPGTFVGYSGAKKIQMYIATRDDTVPTKNQKELVQAWGNPPVIAHDGGHADTIFFTYLNHEDEVVSFLAGKQVHVQKPDHRK